MFKPVSPKLDVTNMEDDVLKFWKDKDIFRKTIDQREGGPEYVFYEGPPTANGKPGVHHVLARAFKDMFPRYKIMRGYRVSRRGGWDTHGLPVEIEVEKRHGFENKQAIEAYGIAKFNEECRKSAFDYIQDWERLTDRIAFWVDLETAYVTFTNDYIESVWNILKNFYERDLLYRGYKIVPYCSRCGTPLSDHEVALGYEKVDDPSIFVRVPVADKPGTSFLVWTTTPWTLPGNVALAVHPDEEYVTIERMLHEGGTEKLILGRSMVDKLFPEEEIKILDTYKGKKLRGTKYNPLFTFMPPEKPAHFIVTGDFVTTEDGSGIVHIAPAFGTEDMQAAQENDLPVLITVLPDGTFVPEVTPWRGLWVKEADSLITEDLRARGLLFREEIYNHTYPFCWRCKTPLLYYAREAWYLRTSQFKNRLVDLNQTINWVPNHIKDGRFGNWLENNVDWALSRERYWGTPLPIWECKECGHTEAVGSINEFSENAGQDLRELDLHRPYVDEITWSCKQGNCRGTMQRVLDLIDVWFDSGSMPYAQWHYPLENIEKFEEQYPADYICEAVDQTRGWFYSLHAISTLMFNRISYRNVLCLGLILDGEGRKMSKSLDNIIDPWDVLDTHGADAFRWYLYTASSPGQERRFSAELVGEVVRDFTLTLWNVYSFFVTYANLDKPKLDAVSWSENQLDRWLLSELNVLIGDVTTAYERYDVPGATRPIETFVEKLSTWYLRRSRRRFWKSESDTDKQTAYQTLYTTLVTISKLLSPTMPFLAEAMYQNLVLSNDSFAPESVALAKWPISNNAVVDEDLNRNMSLVTKLVSLGHSARQKAERKVRQPLAEAAFSVGNVSERETVIGFAELIEDELNVKSVRLLDARTEALSHEVKPLPKQLGQKYGNKFPAIRKSILETDAETIAHKLLEGNSVRVMADGETYDILPDEIEIKAIAKEGFSVAEEGAYVAALVTDMTPDLVAEGLAREFVRCVQDLRKTAKLEVSDRIKLFVKASAGLKSAIETHKEYITNETLTLELKFTKPPAGVPTIEDEFDGEKVNIGFVKA
jgi:isoleucyl-tRNA synthetase